MSKALVEYAGETLPYQKVQTTINRALRSHKICACSNIYAELNK